MTYQVTPGCQVPGLGAIYEQYLGYKSDGRFVEVGAFNCVNWSNTKFLADLGWAGVLIEPNMCLLQECMDVYRDNDHVYVIGCACGNVTDMDRFGKIDRLHLGGSLSTTSPKRIKEYNQIDWAKFSAPQEKKFAYVVTTTLDSVLEDIGWEPGFDVLVVDTEGTEYEVVLGLGLTKWRPKLCIIETHKTSKDMGLADMAGAMDSHFHVHGYGCVYEDHINSIYVLGD